MFFCLFENINIIVLIVNNVDGYNIMDNMLFFCKVGYCYVLGDLNRICLLIGVWSFFFLICNCKKCL